MMRVREISYRSPLVIESLSLLSETAPFTSCDEFVFASDNKKMKKVAEDFRVRQLQKLLKLALVYEKKGEIGRALELHREVIRGDPKGADTASYVRVYLKWILSRDSESVLYFSDASLVDFEENILKPLARQGELRALRDGLETFYRSEALAFDQGWEKNFYALFVLKEFLSLSVEREVGSRYSQQEMEEKMGRVFYNYDMGDKPLVMNKTKLGTNLYLRVLMETNLNVAMPDEALLDYLHQIGCHRFWIDTLRKKFGDGGKQ